MGRSVSGANMAITRILAPFLLLLCLHLEKPIMQERLPNFLLSVRKACRRDSGVRDDAVFAWSLFMCKIRNPALATCPSLVFCIGMAQTWLVNHPSSEQVICLDICICMDVESNPGPENRFECESHTTRLITYRRNKTF